MGAWLDQTCQWPLRVQRGGFVVSRIEDSVAAKIKDRAIDGYIKYQQTMERTDLSRLDWLIHAQEEAMDLSVYLERLIQEFSPKRVKATDQTIKIGEIVVVADDAGDIKSGVMAKVIGPAQNGLWYIEDSLGRVFWMNADNLYHAKPKV